MTKLFLDDERMPPGSQDDWIIVRSYDQAVSWVIHRGWPEFISFDNDLGSDSKEGWQFAQWLIDHDLSHGSMPDNFNFAVHSQNPVRNRDIIERLSTYIAYRRAALNPLTPAPSRGQ